MSESFSEGEKEKLEPFLIMGNKLPSFKKWWGIQSIMFGNANPHLKEVTIFIFLCEIEYHIFQNFCLY